jgi:hypothetical protein
MTTRRSAMFHLSCAVLLLTGGSSVVVAQEKAGAALYQQKVVEPGYDVTVMEIERAAAYSVIRVAGLIPTVTATGMITFRAIYDIARQRGVAYAFMGKASSPPTEGRSAEGWRIDTTIKVFFTNDPNTPLRDLMSSDHTAEVQAMFDRNGYVALAQLDVLFGGRARQ